MEENLQKKFKFEDTTATQKIFSLTKRIRGVKGGTSASKTISILVWLIDYCQSSRDKLTTVTSESYPHLEKGAMLDFENIMKDRGYWDDARWNKTTHTYSFETGCELEFAIFDTFLKAHGPRRDVLFINEGNNMKWNIVDQLIIRTREIIWIDWNPSVEFWFDTEILPNRNDVDYITLTYKDNEALDEITVSEIESHKGNKNWWKVYGLGQLGEVEGRIYTGWLPIEGIPDGARLVRKGLDFGYSNGYTALIDIYRYNGGFIWDELLYRRGMFNEDIAQVIKSSDDAIVRADSAEPKSIDEIKGHGVNILPAHKGPGSVNQGIQFIQAQQIWVTTRSVNIWKEYRAYLWLTDKDGKIINEPQKFNNHAMDAGRYGMEDFMPEDPKKSEEAKAAVQSIMQSIRRR